MPGLESRDRWVKRIAVGLVAVGFIGWFGGFFLSCAGSRFIPDSMPLPWSEPDGMAVDDEGRLYLALNFYKRVQVYDSEGRFVRGWFLPAEDKNYRLRMAADRTLEALSSGRSYRYSKSGAFLDSRGVSREDWNSIDKTSCTAVDPATGRPIRYELRGKLGGVTALFPRVKRISPEGWEETAAATPWFLWPFQAVLPCFAWAAAGIVLLNLRRLRTGFFRHPWK